MPTSPAIIADVRTNVKTQSPPPHLTKTEAELWLRAEELRGNGDRDAYLQARRALLLAQAARYGKE